jgi:nitrate/nitrite transport system permease protein
MTITHQPRNSGRQDQMPDHPANEQAADQAADIATLNAADPTAAPAAAPGSSTPSSQRQRDPIGTRSKHALLKIIDLTALGFLEPVVRLCYREEPQVQLRKIGRFVVVPIIAFIVFIALWTVLAPAHKTKSGEVPTPAVVYEAWDSIARFAERENAKAAAYEMTGSEREAEVVRAREQLEALAPRVTEAKAAVESARSEVEDQKDVLIAPLQADYDNAMQDYRTTIQERTAELQARAETLAANDTAGKQQYLEDIRALATWKDTERDRIGELRDQIDAIRADRYPTIDQALKEQTRLAEREQFLKKYIDLLSAANREVKVTEDQAQLAAMREDFAGATGPQLFSLGNRITLSENRMVQTTASTYAQPKTLFYQIKRSIICVFAGFLIGSAIAIPIGILCGLSSTFMAAMTPFIALFKPVSPIVWLPIALIVVGGFIPDPDSHPVIEMLWSLPWLGSYEINPAFMASAITVALCSLWATMTNTALGVASVDKDHLNVARVLRLGFWSRLFKIVLPSALPLVFAGLRISLGVGWMVLIAAELLSSSEGIGKFVWDQFNNGASDSFAKMMVVVFVVGVIGLILDRIMIVFQRMVSFEGSVASI